MLNSHLCRLRHNKMTWLLFAVIILIPFIEILLVLKQTALSSESYHPSFAFFLSAASIGHAPQIILLWCLPLYLLLLGVDDAVQDAQTGYKFILITKVGKKKYIQEKMITAFIMSFFVMLTSLLINFVILLIIFHDGTFMKGLENAHLEGNILFNWSIANPYLTVLIFILVASILAGFCGLVGAALSLLFKDKKLAYTMTFFTWFMLVLNKKSLMLIFQPFSEISLPTFITIFSTALIIFIIISIVVYIYEVYVNEF